MGASGFIGDQQNRRRRSAVMLGGTFLVLWLAASLTVFPVRGNLSVLPATAVGVATYLAIAYFVSGKAALKMTGAVPAGPEHAQFVNVLAEMSIAAGIATPKAYVINDPAPNAFAAGRNADHATVAATTGLLATMTRDELQGVVAHEVAHIANKDIAIGTLAVIATAATAFLADIALRTAFAVRGRDSAQIRLALFAAAGALYLVAVPAGMLLKAGLSRSREGLADATAVAYTRSPSGLRSALEKLEADTSVVSRATAATAHLWIESPLDRSGKRGVLGRLLDTHPPLAERIGTLRAYEGLDPNGRGDRPATDS